MLSIIQIMTKIIRLDRINFHYLLGNCRDCIIYPMTDCGDFRKAVKLGLTPDCRIILTEVSFSDRTMIHRLPRSIKAYCAITFIHLQSIHQVCDPIFFTHSISTPFTVLVRRCDPRLLGFCSVDFVLLFVLLIPSSLLCFLCYWLWSSHWLMVCFDLFFCPDPFFAISVLC